MKQFGSFALDSANECLWRGEVQIALPPKPFAVLRYLVENPGRLITHDELLDKLWPEIYVQPQVLRTYMLDLRKALADDARQPLYIQTIPKRGYRFVAAVDEVATGARQSFADSGSRAGANLPAGDSFSARATEQSAIVDREDELMRLRVGLQAAANGTRRVVFITGETGIGKTALVDAFCREIESPSRIARGQCVQGVGAKEKYYPVMEALGHLCASPDGDEACGVLARVAPAWLGALGREATGVDGAQARPAHEERLLGDLCGALEELALHKPLILAFEDVHWADDATLDLISALARRRANARLMVLATYRPHDLAGEQAPKELMHDLLMRRLCEEIALAPLSKAALKQLLSRELRQEELPAELAGFVYQHSEGNPLFAIAILEHLIAQRFLVREGSGASACWQQRAPLEEMEAEAPHHLAQMIELEIERLTPDEQRLLEAASLINVVFPAWAVAAALDEDAASTEEACDDLARRLYFVKRAGQDELPDGSRSAFYVFAHELYRDVLYRRQAAARRAKRHIRIAERLGELFAGRMANVAREMAMHFEAAGDWQRAFGALRSAAAHAQQRESCAEAEELLAHALRVANNLNDADRALATQQIRGELSKSRSLCA